VLSRQCVAYAQQRGLLLFAPEGVARAEDIVVVCPASAQDDMKRFFVARRAAQ
jgi:hypothetical protein